MSYVIGVDVGGTNTDTAILCDGRVVTKAKTPTTEDKTGGVVSSIQAALNNLSENDRADVLNYLDRVSIGTTHFVNAVKKRDEGSLDRVAVMRLCGSASKGLPPFSDFPEDLRALVFGGAYMVNGGLEYNGKEIAPVDPDEVRRCVQQILSASPLVKNVVISGVFAPCDDPCGRQEKLVERMLADEFPEISCTLSHQLGMLGLIERENAAVLNQSLKRLAKFTITAFEEALAKLNIYHPFYLTQNDGTMISAEEAMQFPVLTFSSGPTNSMRGAAYLTGLQNAIVVDIGGTTTDVGVLRNGFPREASTYCMIGDVRTNFSMPDVQSIPLGGGTLIQYDSNGPSVTVGPGSVEHKIKQEALCFGGGTCTATDVAIAAGIAPQGIGTTVPTLGPQLVYAALREIRRKLEAAIDSMKTEKEDVPVILVGGGCILVDLIVPLKGASRVILPPDNWGVANAVGAALGSVGGTCDLVMDLGPIKQELRDSVSDPSKLEHSARGVALEKGRELARAEVVRKKCAPKSVYIHSEEVSVVQYVMDRVRVKVKAIGTLTTNREKVDEEVVVEIVQSLCAVPHEEESAEEVVKENPYWPFTSAEDRERDEAARLPHPQVEGADWILSVDDIECLATGAGILGCGGGGDPHCGRIQATQMLKEGKKIKIVNPCKADASKMGLVCNVAFMGAPVVVIEKLVGGDETMLAFRRLQQAVASGVCEGGGKTGNELVRVEEKTCQYHDGTSFPTYVANSDDLSAVPLENVPLSRQITCLTCAEAGGFNSIEPLLVGAKLGLPVLDMDGMGRAFPELQMFVPFINGRQHCPSALADNKGETVVCTSVGSSQQLENFFRMETVRMGMSAAIATGVMPFGSALSDMVLYTMSQAWQLGRAVQRAVKTHGNVVKAIAQQQGGLVLISGKVVSVDRDSGDGFTTVISMVEGLEEFAGYQVRVQAKNENYVAEKIGSEGEPLEVLACTPDLISVVVSDTGVPVTTEQIRYGLRVGVVVLPANPKLKTAQALEVVGPRAFKFDIDYREPRPLIQEDT